MEGGRSRVELVERVEQSPTHGHSTPSRRNAVTDAVFSNVADTKGAGDLRSNSLLTSDRGPFKYGLEVVDLGEWSFFNKQE